MTSLADLVFAALANKSGLTPASAYSLQDHALYVLINGSGGGGSITLPVGDFGGTNTAPTVVSTHLTSPLPVNQGGTGSTTQNTNAGDTTTKSYVDAAIASLQLKPEAQWGTTGALATNTYLAGVITAVGNGALSVDGTAVAVGDRILVKNEITQANNGLYVVTANGSAGAVFVLTRTTDMNTGAEIPGALVVVQKGTVNSGSLWGVFNPGPFTIGTTAIVWTGLDVGPDLVAGTGIVVTGSTISANTLDTIPNPTAARTMNAQKITGLANGSSAQDAAAYGQIPLVDSTSTDIKPPGVQAAGNSGKWADGTHVHPGAATIINATNATWPIPAGATQLEIIAVGGGGAGASSGTPTTTTLQAGSGGGGPGETSIQIVSVGANTTLNVTIGAGGTGPGTTAANGSGGTAGGNGTDTTVTGTGISVTGKGGSGGAPSSANSTTQQSGGIRGVIGTSGRSSVQSNGPGSSANGGMAPNLFGGGGGAGGAAATTTNGGGASGAGTLTTGGSAGSSGGSGTANGGTGVAAAANTGAGGAGGSGGATNAGTGGGGGNGGSGLVIIRVIG